MVFQQPRWVVGGTYRNIPLPPLPLLKPLKRKVPKYLIKYMSEKIRCQEGKRVSQCLEVQVPAQEVQEAQHNQ
jgi:hypothetical protein